MHQYINEAGRIPISTTYMSVCVANRQRNRRLVQNFEDLLVTDDLVVGVRRGVTIGLSSWLGAGNADFQRAILPITDAASCPVRAGPADAARPAK